MNLWAKCFNHKKLAIIFNILALFTVYLFMLNVVLMVLWRYNHDGKVCSGDFLTQAEKNNKDISKHYLIEKGWFIEVTLKVIFACVLLVCLSIMLVAICFSTGGIKRKNSTTTEIHT